MFGAVVVARPLRVVADTDVLAAYLPIGTQTYGPIFTSRENAMDDVESGAVRWGMRGWVDHNVLMLVRAGDPYSVSGFWTADGRFVCWYVNLQDPLERTPIGFDSRDHTLDLVVGEDLASWLWKDEAELARAVTLGLFTAEEAAAFRANGEAVIAALERGEAWWRSWRDFVADDAWPQPLLLDGWDVT